MKNPHLRSFIIFGLAALGLALGWLLPRVSTQAAELLNLTPAAYLPVVLRQPTPTPTATPIPTITPTPTQTPPFFESGYTLNGDFESADPSTQTGNAHWLPWWFESPRPGDGSFNYASKPNSFNRECLSTGAASVFVQAGDCSQRILNNWDPWWAGVRQQTAAPAGQRVRLTAYARVWATGDSFPAPSEPNVNVRVQVGIEPNGNCDPFAGTVVWSAPAAPHDVWQAQSVETTVGAGGQVCLFLGTDYRGETRFNLASFWDSVSLTTP
jgi:hypothetical protein